MTCCEYEVALRKESVDRNIQNYNICVGARKVALRKESVDRNMGVGTTRDSRGVALRKESVDRNTRSFLPIIFSTVSLSARRAWIEIVKSMSPMYLTLVALRKESVDRNIGAS